jgi:hypothetical protein
LLQQKTKTLSQQKTEILLQQKTKTLSQQKTEILLQQKTKTLSQQKTGTLYQQKPHFFALQIERRKGRKNGTKKDPNIIHSNDCI